MQVDTLWVRHGESTWNRAGLMQGQTGWPALTIRGIGQAHPAADELRHYNPVRLVSSDLRRASQTAQIIGTRLALPADHTGLLRERRWGVYEGQPTAEGHQAALSLMVNEAVPQGESREDVRERLRWLLPLLAQTRGPIVVVTHGDVIREAITLWAKEPDDDPPGNGSIIRISALVDAPPSRHLSRSSRDRIG